MAQLKAALAAQQALSKMLALTSTASSGAVNSMHSSFKLASPFVKEHTHLLTALNAAAGALVTATAYTVVWRDDFRVKMAEQSKADGIALANLQAKMAEQSKADGIALANMQAKMAEQSKADGIAFANMLAKMAEQSKADGIAIAALQTTIAEKDRAHSSALLKLELMLSDKDTEHAIEIATIKARRWFGTGSISD